MEEMVGTPKMIRLLNKDVIEGIIKANGPITKPEIARMTNLSLVTVNKAVDNLITENRVRVSGINESTGGRRAQFFEINSELYYIIGLYYDKNIYFGAISNSIGEIIYEKEFGARTDSYDEIMEDTYHAIDTLLEQCGSHPVSAIGIGVPGVVNNGLVTDIPTIPSWEEINVSMIIEDKYKIKVFLENDINLAAMGVYHQKYREEVDNLALVYFEQGLGSGLILNRTLFKGSTNFAGELSYIPVHNSITIDGKKTKYKGNFENRLALLREAVHENGGKPGIELKEMLQRTIADGLLSIVCVINPEIIVLKCGFLTDGDLEGIEKRLRECVGRENVPKLVQLEEITKCSMQGVIHMCYEETMPIYSLSSKKRG